MLATPFLLAAKLGGVGQAAVDVLMMVLPFRVAEGLVM